MELLKHMPDLAGCHVLTPSGMLCEIGSGGVCEANPELTNEIAGPIRAFVDTLRQQRDTRWAHLGIVHGDHTRKSWKTSTLALSDDALRRLYPMGGAATRDLPVFRPVIVRRVFIAGWNYCSMIAMRRCPRCHFSVRCCLTAIPCWITACRGPSARQPVAFLKPRLFTIHSTTPVEFLWIYEPLGEAVRRLYPASLRGLEMG